MTARRIPLRKLLRLALFAAAAASLAFAASFFALWLAVDFDEEAARSYPGGVVLRDSAGRVIRVSLGAGDVDSRPWYRADPDDWIVKALVAAEDGEFWTHSGVRPLSVARAAFQNVIHRRRISGASTITMQAVRLVEPHPKTLFWKALEAVKAIKLERRHDKLWIISQYLNRAPFGANFVGVEAAAAGWFGKSAHSLGLGEAACLAGMVQAPSRFRPDRALDKALRRREYVLSRMLALGMITPEQRDAARSVRPQVVRSPRPFLHPHFCDWALAALALRGDSGGDIVTTLDADIQRVCENAVAAGSPSPESPSSAAVVVRVRDGAVLAMASSGDYFDERSGQFNTAVAPRPAGSTLKPFLVARALDRGIVTPLEVLADRPISIDGYCPVNFDNRYRGSVSVRDALILSLNVPFVELLSRVGVGDFATTLRSMGFQHLGGTDETFGLGLAIGNAEVSLLELAGAYATLARGALAFAPMPVARTNAAAIRVFSPGAAYLVSEMLSGDERSEAALGHIADAEVPRFAWKTGTSSAYRDAWTVAWNREYVVAFWRGHLAGGFGDRTLVGARASAGACWQIARSLYPDNSSAWFSRPGDVVRRSFCARSGLVATSDCAETVVADALGLAGAGRLCDRCGASGGGAPARAEGARRVAISRPRQGDVIRVVGNFAQQKVVCAATGVGPGERLWWFLDGAAVGETTGTEPLVLDPVAGTRELTATAADGASATVRFSVVFDSP